MAGKDIIGMSERDRKKLKVVQEAIDGQITQRRGALMLRLSERQVRRVVRAVREEGDRGVIHKSRGKPSNRRIQKRVKEKILKFYRKKYRGFGPTLSCEKLEEMEGIKISDETMRKWLMEAGEWEKRRKRKAHRQWRERKECFGEMVQMDGSQHDWLEGRGAKLALMGYIDDATNNVYGRFYDYEGTMPAMESFKRYVKKYGLPQSVYLDRHTTYKSPRELTLEEELEGISKPKSQFERALGELEVEVIHAYSPQAKGRVERLFGVLQDRLVKEMRLRGIKTKEEANEFLKEYLPKHNKRFRVSPANDTDVHVKPAEHVNLDSYLCIKTARTVRNDNTIAYEGRLYQIETAAGRKKVTVEERVDGSLQITSGGSSLRHTEITGIPKKENIVPVKIHQPRKRYTPPKDHPWRRWQKRESSQTDSTYPKPVIALGADR